MKVVFETLSVLLIIFDFGEGSNNNKRKDDFIFSESNQLNTKKVKCLAKSEELVVPSNHNGPIEHLGLFRSLDETSFNHFQLFPCGTPSSKDDPPISALLVEKYFANQLPSRPLDGPHEGHSNNNTNDMDTNGDMEDDYRSPPNYFKRDSLPQQRVRFQDSIITQNPKEPQYSNSSTPSLKKSSFKGGRYQKNPIHDYNYEEGFDANSNVPNYNHQYQIPNVSTSSKGGNYFSPTLIKPLKNTQGEFKKEKGNNRSPLNLNLTECNNQFGQNFNTINSRTANNNNVNQPPFLQLPKFSQNGDSSLRYNNN